MKTLEEMIAVMTAYKEGKEIEAHIINTTNTNCWGPASTPTWDWAHFDYRVKPEPKYRPYANAEEFFAEMKKHGEWVWRVGEKDYVHIDRINNKGIHFSSYFQSFGGIVNDLVWADDGTPCGVLE